MKFGMQQVQLASIAVQIARKFKKTERKTKPAGKRPKPNTQMDPDLQNASGALD